MAKLVRIMGTLITVWIMMVGMAFSQSEAFHSGPVIPEFGPIADVEMTMPIPDGTQFKIAFDVTAKADVGEINRHLISAARFINMHVAAGVPQENIHLALVFHGGASLDLTNDAFHAEKNEGASNGSAEAIAILINHNVRIIICGQSAAAHGISNLDLLPDVEVALSAMTAHALLQQSGYSINPF